jgi:hypothetical protein
MHVILPERYDDPPLPRSPADPLDVPGSPGKRKSIWTRAANRKALWHPDDALELPDNLAFLYPVERIADGG